MISGREGGRRCVNKVGRYGKVGSWRVRIGDNVVGV